MVISTETCSVCIYVLITKRKRRRRRGKNCKDGRSIAKPTSDLRRNRFYCVKVTGLINSMELSTTREIPNCLDTRQFPSILWNPKVQYRTLKKNNWIAFLLCCGAEFEFGLKRFRIIEVTICKGFLFRYC
jgi:hypothetical protein